MQVLLSMTMTPAEPIIRVEGLTAGYGDFILLENVTFAPAMNQVPTVGDEGANTSARENLSAFVNGPVGKNNPKRRGD